MRGILSDLPLARGQLHRHRQVILGRMGWGNAHLYSRTSIFFPGGGSEQMWTSDRFHRSEKQLLEYKVSY